MTEALPEVVFHIYPADCDMLGHVNHATMLAFLERARWELLERQDVGGVLGAVTRDIYSEGLQLPFVKVFSGGVENQELTAIIRDNSRTPDLAMGAVGFTNVWRGIPFFAIMLLAGLQAVPDELYEAAHVDGAGVLARFWHITLPLLRPIIVVATATRIIWTFNYADLIFVMTSGGPANATQITSTYTLLQAYSSLDFGYAGALSVVLLLVMLVFTALYLRVTKGVEETG